MIRQRTGDNGGQQKFDVFVANVKSGKWQLTADRWLEGMRRERATAEAYRKAGASTVELMQDFVWASLAGILLQTCVVFSVRKTLIER